MEPSPFFSSGYVLSLHRFMLTPADGKTRASNFPHVVFEEHIIR